MAAFRVSFVLLFPFRTFLCLVLIDFIFDGSAAVVVVARSLIGEWCARFARTSIRPYSIGVEANIGGNMGGR